MLPALDKEVHSHLSEALQDFVAEFCVEYQLNEPIVWLAIQNNSSMYLEFLREQDK